MSATQATWYQIENINELDTPALILYPERIKENIIILKGFINDVTRLRPHVKTHKCIEVTSLMLDAGISKFKCATIAEAEMLAMSGAPDVLLAYQPVLTKIHRFINLVKNYPSTGFSCLIDNVQSAAMISEEAEKAGIIISVFVDVNIGMNRTGILPAQVLDLYAACSSLKGIITKGLHAYDGHIYNPDLAERTMECHEAFKDIEPLTQKIIAQGYCQPVVVAGGTPTYPILAQMQDVECSPGTFIFWDEGYGSLFPDLPFLPAALVATRVISVLDDYTLCIDMGHKAIAAENDLDKRVVFLNAPGVQFISHSEEHLVIRTPEKHEFTINDVLYGLPVHICPTCNLYASADVINNHQATNSWKIIARDRKINY